MKNSLAKACLLFVAMSSFAISTLAQRTPCDSPHPSSQVLATVQQNIASAGVPPNLFTWEIPVRATVFLNDDGSGWGNFNYETTIDNFLSNMNSELVGGPNTYHFYRCGPINYIHVSELRAGDFPVEDYSYAPNFLNLYLYQDPSTNPHAAYPWNLDIRNALYLTGGPNDISSGAGIHELGHTLGLLHPFVPSVAYIVPPTPVQSDWPYNANGARELMLSGYNVAGKEFKDENRTFAGDGVADTPPGCEDDANKAFMYPSATTIAGCLDNDPNTLCKNGCLDNDPNTPCLSGCSYDFNNCTYTGTYRDYNYDPIQDPNNVLARNHMSYTGICRQEFTPGQIERADQIFNFYWKNYYLPELCGTLDDKVEIEATSTGVDRAFIKVFDSQALNWTRTVSNPQGQFSGVLPSTNLSVTVTADVKKLGSLPDFGFTPGEWYTGVSTLDYVHLQKFILGINHLNGYRQIAADVNRSGGVTTFDLVELRKLILTIYDKLPNYDQPWVFIPEWVTLNMDLSVHEDFDGLNNDDNPFNMMANGQQLQGAPYINSGWPFVMKNGTNRNGFDAVKIGNVFGGYPTGLQTGECSEENITLVMPNTSLPTNTELDLTLSGYNFANVAAFQLGLTADSDDFEYISSESTVLDGFGTEISVGGINIAGKEGLKTLWVSPTLTPKTVTNGTNLLKFRLRTKNAIPDLQAALKLEKNGFKSGFWTINEDCIGNISLQGSVNIIGGERSSEGSNISTIEVKDKLICVPNPANDAVQVIYDADGDFFGSLNFYDVRGSLILSQEQYFQAGRNIVHFPQIEGFPSGVLSIVVKGDKVNHVARMVKQ